MQRNFEQLKATNCLKLENGTPVIWPSVGKPGRLNVSSIIRDARIDHAFSIRFDVVGIIDQGEYFVAPLSHDLVDALRRASFVQARFHVPFSNGDTPLGEVLDSWNSLLAATR